MYVNDSYQILKNNATDEIVIKIEGEYIHYTKADPKHAELYTLYREIRGHAPDDRQGFAEMLANFVDTCAPAPIPERAQEEILVSALAQMISFFSEFQFEPNFRFLNSFALALAKSKTNAKNYCTQYFELIDSPYCNEIKQKMESPEFNTIVKDLSLATPTKVINSRFKLYYGSQGTGKTTIAMGETDNRVMVCNSSMLPADIMEDFVFIDGKATFQPSALWQCMVEGKKIVLDEINLLPFDTLRFLQTILDGKKEFLYKGNNIVIADGFQIIGTMNLTVNGMTYGLPEPLVDRCAETRKFTLAAQDLLAAIQ